MTNPWTPGKWEEFKKFMLRDDVVVPNKLMLRELFRFYEYGNSKTFPPDWVPYLELQALRRDPNYNKICIIEEKIGKYNGRAQKREVEEEIIQPIKVKKVKK